MKRIAIIDDDVKIRQQLQEYLSRFGESYKEQFQIKTFSFPELFLTDYKPEYDIIFMDIDMPGMDGLKASRRFRELDEKTVLIFVTNLAQYAIKGYEVAATDFVVKPVKYDVFEKKLQRAFRFIPVNDKATLMLKTENGLVSVEVDDIQFIEVQGHNVFYHTAKDVYRIRGSLKESAREIDSDKFFMCDKCYLVNLAYVEAVKGNTVTVSGQEINVSRPKKKLFMDALAQYHSNWK